MISLITTDSFGALKITTLNSGHSAWSYLMILTCPLWVAIADIRISHPDTKRLLIEGEQNQQAPSLSLGSHPLEELP